MTPVTTPPAAGGMTVLSLLGWEEILTALLVLVFVAAAALVTLAAGRAANGRPEWQEWLDERSAQRRNEWGDAGA